MRRHPLQLLWPCLLLAGCGPSDPPARADVETAMCQAPAVRETVERMGERLKRVSLLAPDSAVARDIHEAYANLVTPTLLARWLSEPALAPGRRVSSPWPERLEIRSMEAAEGGCQVQGHVVYVTSSSDPEGEAASREPVTLLVEDRGAWLISRYDQGGDVAGRDTGDTGGADAVPGV